MAPALATAEGGAPGGPVPAVLLIPGGTTDRDGDTPMIPAGGRGPGPTVAADAIDRQQADAVLAEARRAVEQLRASGSSPTASWTGACSRCSARDIQVPCDTLTEVREALEELEERPGDAIRFVEPEGVENVLKEIGDTPSTGAEYGTHLPFTTGGTEDLTEVLGAHLDPDSG